MRKEHSNHSHRRRDGANPMRSEIRRECDGHSQNIMDKKHHKKVAEQEHRYQNKGKTLKHPSDHQARDDFQNSSNSRRDWRDRNSPVELIRNRQNTDSSSESDPEQNHNATKHNHRKRVREESFEELSRRKRKIESELSALDAEEAAARRKGKKHVNHRNHNRKESTHHREERPVRIKDEPLSDEERRRPSRDGRRHHRSGSEDTKLEWGKPEKKEEAKSKEKPNFQISGKLAEDTNTYNGVVIKYNEPKEARKPKRKWRLYPFKGEVSLPYIPVHRQSAYLLGRTRLIADIPIDHPSCSKQHAVLQFRLLPYQRDDGSNGRSVRPYVIDLDSSNGTYVNNNRIEPRRYVELFEKDVLKFGFSTRVYVILHEDSKNADVEDDEAEGS